MQSTLGNWGNALQPDQRNAVLAVALEVAGRTVDAGRLEQAPAAVKQSSRERDWEAQTVAGGDAGLALLCGHLDKCFPNQDWDVAAHRFLVLAIRAAERLPVLPPGLLTGVSGLAFVASTLGRGGIRYQRLLAALDEALLDRAVELVAAVRARTWGVDAARIDLVSGLSGIGAGLLSRPETSRVRSVLTAILDTLVELTSTADGTPLWHSPPDLLEPEAMGRFPGGRLDLGLAHGIPGPMGLMAVALGAGVEVPGQREALRATCDWLVERRLVDEWGVAWPAAMPVAEPADGAAAGPAGDSRPPQAARTAWCYGAPGVARVLWLCGEALEDPALRLLAVEAMGAVYRRPIVNRDIDSPTFCHGVSGLLQITLRFAHDTHLAMFHKAAGALVAQLLRAYEPERLFGYRGIGPGGRRFEQAGVLDGSGGVVLVLLAASTDIEPVWDRLFMLS